MTILTNISLLKDMYNYQTKFNIINKCVENSVYYTDMINMHFPTEKCNTQVGILYYLDTTLNQPVQVNHCWVVLNGNIVDPSIQYIKIPYKKTYYSSLNEYFKCFQKQVGTMPKYQKTYTITTLCNLQKMINQFNKNKKVTTEYYKEIRNYIIGVYKDNEKEQKSLKLLKENCVNI